MGLHAPELIALVLVVLLVFGAKRLPEMGSNVAKGIREFKKGINDEEAPNPAEVKQEAPSLKSIDASKSEVEAIEAQLARKKAELAAQERVATPGAE